MSKIKLFLNKSRIKYYDRMMYFCADRATTTENITMQQIWIEYFNKYFNKLMRIEDNVSFQPSKEES